MDNKNGFEFMPTTFHNVIGLRIEPTDNIASGADHWWAR